MNTTIRPLNRHGKTSGDWGLHSREMDEAAAPKNSPWRRDGVASVRAKRPKDGERVVLCHFASDHTKTSVPG